MTRYVKETVVAGLMVLLTSLLVGMLVVAGFSHPRLAFGGLWLVGLAGLLMQVRGGWNVRK